MADTDGAVTFKDGSRWYLRNVNGDRARWGHGSRFVANFATRADAVNFYENHWECDHVNFPFTFTMGA